MCVCLCVPVQAYENACMCYTCMRCDVTTSLESLGSEWHRIEKAEKTQRKALAASGLSHPPLNLPPLPLQNPPAGKDTAPEWYSPGKNAYIYGE